MSRTTSSIVHGDSIHCEPAGTLRSIGWLPGTWVKFVTATHFLNKSALASCDVCGITDYPAAFIPQGSVTLKNTFDCDYPNDNETSGAWTADECQELIAKNPNSEILFDVNHQLAKIGSGIVAVNLQNTGVFKFYVYEKYDKAYRASSGGAGGELDWSAVVGVSPSLYVSSRGLTTCEKENINSIALAYIVVAVGQDENGEYILLASD